MSGICFCLPPKANTKECTTKSKINNKLNFKSMKRIFMCMIVTLSLSMFSFQAKAQWIVADPTNLVQNIVSAVQSVKTVSNMVQNVQEVKKVYDQGKEYYDALKSVNDLIKDARKVKKTIEMISEITDIYMNGFNKMVGDPNFTPNELAAISSGYAKLLEEGGALVTELKDIVTGGNGLSLSDKERMEVIDEVYNKMLRYRNLTKYFTQKSISISYIRAKEKNDMERVLSLYGNPSERYW
jgi:Conjugal transfer/entry exclusion protein